MFTLTVPKLAALLAVAAVFGAIAPLPGGTIATPTAVHALAVPAAQLAGPCEGLPELNADYLAAVFAPAVNVGDPIPVAVVDAQTFTVTIGGATYTAKLDGNGGATVNGPDAASAAMLQRHVGLCLGAFTTTPDDGPGRWTLDGRYLPYDRVDDAGNAIAVPGGSNND